MPVHLDDDRGDVLVGDLFLQVRLPSLAPSRACAAVFELLLELGDLAVLDLGGLPEVARGAARSSARRASSSSCALTLRICSMTPSRAATAPHARRAARRARRSRVATSSRRALLAVSRSFLSACLLDLELHEAPLAPESISAGMLSISILILRGRLVDEIDGLVGQEALGDVAVRERRRGDEGASWMRMPWWTS